MEIVKATKGSIKDLEEMNLDTKLAYLRTNQTLKCPYKTELLYEHEYSWHKNGLNRLQFSTLNRSNIPMQQPDGGQGSAIKITVDVGFNRENTDEYSSMSFVPDYSSAKK